jgi:hypothetical protein
MSLDLSLLPCAAQAREYALEEGLAVAGLPDGRVPGRRDIQEILAELGWRYQETGNDTEGWEYRFPDYDGRRLTVDEMSLSVTGAYAGLWFRVSYRLTSLHGQWEVCRRVALRCGPQVAILAADRTRALLLTAEPVTPYEAFHRLLPDGNTDPEGAVKTAPGT